MSEGVTAYPLAWPAGRPMRATNLLGRPTQNLGPCFWCGGPADVPYAPPSGFVGWSDVAQPASRMICPGCVIATNEADRSRRPRMFSWLVTAHAAENRTKGELAAIRTWCLRPPEPPFAITLAVSGQKHLLYRTPANWTREFVTVQLELERVTYRPGELAARLDLAKRVCAATGKPALTEPPSAAMAARIATYYDNFEPIVDDWFNAWAEPLSRLAAHLCPSKEEAQHEHPSTHTKPAANLRRRVVSAQAGGSDGPGLFGL